MMDNNIARAREGVDKQIVIFDMHGFSALQSNLTMIRTLITINQEYYPERLSLGVLVNVPWLFHAIWKVIYPWIDHKTRTKIKLLGRNDNIADILLEHIDADVLGVEADGEEGGEGGEEGGGDARRRRERLGPEHDGEERGAEGGGGGVEEEEGTLEREERA